MKIFIITLIAALSGLTQAQVDLTQLCLDKTLGDVLPHPLDCASYIVCNDQEEEPAVYNCEFGFHFDAVRKVCNWPENANCQLAPQPTKEIATTEVKPLHSTLMALDVLTGEVVDPLTNYDPENVLCRHFGAYFLPHPQQCRSYYLCAYGHMHEHSCGQGTLWNYLTQQCVLNHKAKCYHVTKEEKKEIENSVVCYPLNSTTTTIKPPTVRPTTASATPNIITPTRTPKPTRPTVASLTTARPPPTYSTKRPNSSNPYHIICPPKRQSYVAHPKDCGKYFMCIMGTPILTSCPVGLYWDTQKEFCDLPQNVRCFQ